MKPDNAIYVTFSRPRASGTKVIATRGYHGVVIARLEWSRILTAKEEDEINTAIRLGEARRIINHNISPV